MYVIHLSRTSKPNSSIYCTHINHLSGAEHFASSAGQLVFLLRGLPIGQISRMRASLVCLALRQPLIKFRHGVCNQISASKSNAAALKLSNPSPKAALEVKMPHVVKPLGPGVTVVRILENNSKYYSQHPQFFSGILFTVFSTFIFDSIFLLHYFDFGQVAYKNVKELPAHLHRKAISHDEMTIINVSCWIHMLISLKITLRPLLSTLRHLFMIFYDGDGARREALWTPRASLTRKNLKRRSRVGTSSTSSIFRQLCCYMTFAHTLRAPLRTLKK